MKKSTARNIKKAIQLRHAKEKLYEMKQSGSIYNIKPYKKINLIKSLKNLIKREERKGL